VETGFCDQGHLTRAFKRSTGTTPARFRRRMSDRAEKRPRLPGALGRS
jgi:AraC-like DNA-binding protein